MSRRAALARDEREALGDYDRYGDWLDLFRNELDALVREAAAVFLEMLVLERHRIWILHTVTGPAAALARHRHVDDALCRSVAAQWFGT